MIFDKYPYTNFHEMNDDWVIQTLREFGKRLDEFVAANSLTYADPIEYDPGTTYPAYTVLIYNGTAYMSKVLAPAGVLPTNGDYYLQIFPFGDLIQRMVDEGVDAGVDEISERVDTYVQTELGNVPVLVNQWMNEHPEITTPIPDESVSFPKLNRALSEILLINYPDVSVQTVVPKTDFVQGGIDYLTGEDLAATNACRTDFITFPGKCVVVLRTIDQIVMVYKYTADGQFVGRILSDVDNQWNAFASDTGYKFRFTIANEDLSDLTPEDLPAAGIFYFVYSNSAEADIESTIASEYSSASTYNVNDYVFYSGALYRCVTAITTAEAWTAAHWETVALADDVSGLKSDLNQLEERVSTLDGLTPIALESGNIGYGWSALAFTDSTSRMRTPQNGGVQVSVGDVITMENWTGNAFYPIIYESDNHYHEFGWKTSDFEIPDVGVLYFIIRKDPERVLTESDVFNIFLKKPDRISAIEAEALIFSEDISELKKDKKENVSPILVSHRGFQALYPENTVLGVLGAKKYGYTITEADLQITSDGHFVMCHDATVDGTTDGTGTISEMTLAQVKACNIDKWGSYTYDSWTWGNLKIPTIEEYLTACIYCDITPMIEARDFSEAQLDTLIGIIRQFGLEDSIIVESFTKATINYLRSQSAQLRLCALLNATTDDVDYCANAGNCFLAINATSANPTAEFMSYALSRGVQIVAWTVNALDRIQELSLLGVSYVITDINVNGNSTAEAFPIARKIVPDVNSDTPDNWGFRYYVGDMISTWGIDCEALKTIVSFSGEVYYDTNKPEMRICSSNVALQDKVGDWQTVKADVIIPLTSSLRANAPLYLKLAETGNVKMRNASVKFYGV